MYLYLFTNRKFYKIWLLLFYCYGNTIFKPNMSCVYIILHSIYSFAKEGDLENHNEGLLEPHMLRSVGEPIIYIYIYI